MAEIVVGSGAGIKTTVTVFDVSTTAMVARRFTPFRTSVKDYYGGVSLDVARINADLIPDIIVGAGVIGGSLVDVWAWSNTASATLSSLSANGVGFTAFTGPSQTASVQVAAQDSNGDDIADAILAVQGPGGTTEEIRVFDIINVAPLEVSMFTAVPGAFPGPLYVAAARNPSSVTPVTLVDPDLNLPADPIPEPEPDVVTNVWHNYATPADVNGVGGVTAVDALILINYISTHLDLTLPVSPTSPPRYYYDVSGGENSEGDGRVSPLDVLVVINYIKRNAMNAQGESESVTTPSLTSVIEVPIVFPQFDSPEIESPRASAEPSSHLLDVSSRPIRNMPDTGNVFLHERDLQSSDRDDHNYMESVDLETDILELDSLLTDIALDVASYWKRLA
jgi:hypothetical protein